MVTKVISTPHTYSGYNCKRFGWMVPTLELNKISSLLREYDIKMYDFASGAELAIGENMISFCINPNPLGQKLRLDVSLSDKNSDDALKELHIGSSLPEHILMRVITFHKELGAPTVLGAFNGFVFHAKKHKGQTFLYRSNKGFMVPSGYMFVHNDVPSF